VKYINHEIGDHVDVIAKRGFQRVIGTSGTILSLGAVLMQESADEGTEVRNRRLTSKALHRLRKRLAAADLRERLQMPGMDPRRADLIVAGSILFDTILRRLGADDFTLCDLALREGLIIDYIRRNRAHIATIERYPDIRRRSVEELGQRCNYWSEHARHVAHLALSLFDQTKTLHGLGPREREWLEYGALLHDVGVHISYKSHHKHSFYLIRNGDLRGFDPEEIDVIALIARYHRQAAPKKSHDDYGALPAGLRDRVKLLSAFVRVAEGLDRSHAQIIQDISVKDGGEALLVQAEAQGDAELEQWAAQRYLAPLEDAIGKTVRVDLASPIGAAPPEARLR
jgi:exopolyphosphatase/guanosine-5'-triphosphate,3'-diphosphate pyrophosphatase